MPRCGTGLLALPIVFALFGCSTSPTDLESKVEPRSQIFAENYQEIYRRVSTTAKRCMAGNMSATASMAVDAELYSELGKGEITVSLINIGIRNYYVSAKVERLDQKQSKMTVSAGNTLGAQRATDLFFEWASSGANHNCPLV